MADRKDEINAWLSEHGVEQAIAGAVDSAVRAQAADPIQHIADALSKSESGEVATLRKANEEQAAELESLRAEMAKIKQDGLSTHGLAKGEVKGIDAMNNALWRMGALKHKPPSFKYFDPSLEEQRPVMMKEIKLPRASQTHELCYEPKSRCVFISQMSNSILIRIPVGPDGLLADDQDAWSIGAVHPKTGEGVSGLHNISRSTAYPGCLWLSLQFANQLLLLDEETMQIKMVLRCPQLLTRKDGSLIRIGGPHCVRECAQNGAIWVALKGSVPCHPDVTGSSGKGLAAAISRVCCNPEAIKQRIADAAALGEKDGPTATASDMVGAAVPEGFAIWRLDPKQYDPSEKEAYGGTLYECAPSPPMICVDPECNCWTCADKEPVVGKIDISMGERGELQQVPLSLPDKYTLNMTGPAICTAPDGAVWCSLLGGMGSLIRFDPTTGGKMRYELGLGQASCFRSSRFIHIAFHTLKDRWFLYTHNGKKYKCRLGKRGDNVMVAISSNLVENEAINCITAICFSPFVGSGWTSMMQRKEITLPTQDCCCHRIEVISDPDWLAPHKESIVVSMLSSSRLFQVNLHNLEIFDPMYETVTTEKCGDSEVHVMNYETMGGVGAKNLNPDYMKTWRPFFDAMNELVEILPPGKDGVVEIPGVHTPEADIPEAARPLVARLKAVFSNMSSFHDCHKKFSCAKLKLPGDNLTAVEKLQEALDDSIRADSI